MLSWLLGSQPEFGAIDVVAIRHTDGSVHCTPFHVKFPAGNKGKSSKILKLKVNQKDTNLSMKIGAAGEAFFIERTQHHEYVSKRFRSSPPSSPKQNATKTLSENLSKTEDASAKSNVSTDDSSIRLLKDDVFSAQNGRELYPVDVVDVLPSSIAHEQFSTEGIVISARIDTTVTLINNIDTTAIDSFYSKPLSHTHTHRSKPSKNTHATANANANVNSSSHWTWSWGDLPIKSNDPSIAALHKLHNQMKEKYNCDIASPNSIDRSEGGAISKTNSFASNNDNANDSLSPVNTVEDASVLQTVQQIFSHNDNSLGASTMSSYDEGHKLADEQYLAAGDNEVKVSLSEEGFSESELMFNNSVVSSKKWLSLCAHILSGQESSSIQTPSNPQELQEVLKIFAVKDEDFAKDPYKILSDANLVVVLNDDILIPWKLAHDYLTMVSTQKSLHESFSPTQHNSLSMTATSHTQSVNSAEGMMSDSLHFANNGLDYSWIGSSISSWGNTSKDCGLVCHSPHLSSGKMSHSSVTDSAHSVGHISDNALESHSERIANSAAVQIKDEFDEFEVGIVECSDRGSIGDPSIEIVEGEGDMLNGQIHVPWTKAGLDWNSVEDFQRLMNAFSKLNSVSDLIKPYLAREVSVENNDAIGASNHVLLTAESLHDINNNSQIIVPPSKRDEVLAAVDPVGSKVEEAKDDVLVAMEYLSLNDISPDDILPGPARGDIYDDGASDTESYYSLDEEGGSVSAETGRKIARKYLFRKSLVPTQEQIISMNLKEGQNELSFEIEGCAPIKAQLFMWPEDSKIVVADMEGAMFVSKIQAGGSLLFWPVRSLLSSKQQSETHEGLAEFFNNVAKNGYRFLYLTTKPLAHSSTMKDHLMTAKHGNSGDLQLPIGPVFLPPEALIQGGVESNQFKSAALRGLQSLFPQNRHSFHAAFGGNPKDIRAFERCGVPPNRIYTVDQSGESKLLSNIAQKRTFRDLHGLVNEIFVPVIDSFSRTFEVTSKLSQEDTYSDVNFWRLRPPPINSKMSAITTQRG